MDVMQAKTKNLRGQATLVQAISPFSVQMQLLHGPNLVPGMPDNQH
jgi:hypothetical protein